MADKELWDRLVNSKWPSEKNLVPTEQEAIRGAKRLYRIAMGHAWTGKVKLTSGNRYTWIRHGVLYVNPNHSRESGWKGIVHCISHWAHYRKNPQEKPHSPKQAYIERDLVDYVLSNGWLDGSLKKTKAKPKPKIDIVQVRYQRILKREAAWKAKLSRAKNAWSKLDKQRREYEQRYGSRLT